ncbi:MAG: hypothetical protein KGY80_08795 [Candidatus Thorarchaeota archaeon]|nr:hypothetical protein [Candidatus Thorarchaeota archaeon]
MCKLEHLKNFKTLRIYSFLTSLILALSIFLSQFGVLGNVLIQSIASITIILGTILELIHILILIQLTNRDDKVGWVLHRFAYGTLGIMIFSFLSIVSSTFLSTFFIFGRDVMIVAVIGYVMQASFGVCLSSISYHFATIEDAWQN